MSIVPRVQGQLLEVTVVGCYKLKDTEWFSRQDPYVCLDYGSSKFRTRTCKDGGKNPTFQEKFVFTLIEGLKEINLVVWNSNTIYSDDFIGSGKVQLQKVLSQGYDDSSWPLQTKTGRHAGEVRLIMHYSNTNSEKPMKSSVPSAPPYTMSPVPQPPYYSAPPPPPTASSTPYPPPSAAYPAVSSYPSYPPTSTSYTHPYPLPPQSAPYPPQAYAQPQVYPPPPYPPPPQGPPYYAPGTHPGPYLPRPY